MTARENLRSAFERWRHAYGDLKWEAFLYRVLSLSETGLWVKEVAEFELNLLSKEGSRWE